MWKAEQTKVTFNFSPNKCKSLESRKIRESALVQNLYGQCFISQLEISVVEDAFYIQYMSLNPLKTSKVGLHVMITYSRHCDNSRRSVEGLTRQESN